MWVRGLGLLWVSVTMKGDAAAGVAPGVPQADFYPSIETYRAKDFRANPLCENLPAGIDVPWKGLKLDINYVAPRAINLKAEGYPYRITVGLREFCKAILEQYRMMSKTPKDLLYAAKNGKNKGDFFSMLNSGMAAASHDHLNQASPVGEMRSSLKVQMCNSMAHETKPAPSCYALGNFSWWASCHSQYEYENPSEVLASLNPSNNFGATDIPEKCLAPLASGRHPLNFGLHRHPNGKIPRIVNKEELFYETRVYYLLRKAIDKLQRYAEFTYLTALEEIQGHKRQRQEPASDPATKGIHNIFLDTMIFEDILPGWKVMKCYYLNEPKFKNGPTLRTPYAVLAVNAIGDMLVVFRQAMTTYEARLALSTHQSFKYLVNFTGEAHDGAATIYRTLSGVMESDIIEHVKDKWLLSAKINPRLTGLKLTFTGMDLPANGAALLLADHLAEAIEKFRARNPVGNTVRLQVSLVAFGSSLLTNQESVTNIMKRVEIRNVVVETDSSDLFPCEHTLSCDETLLAPRTGVYSGIAYTYESLPGRFVIPLDELAAIDKKWGEDGSLFQLAAVKDCAYDCWLAKAQCPEDTAEMQKCGNCKSFV